MLVGWPELCQEVELPNPENLFKSQPEWFTLLVQIGFDDGSRRQKPTPGDRQGWRGTETASGPEDAAEACGGAKTWGVLSVHGDLVRVGLKENVRDNNQRLGSHNKRHPFGFHPKHLFRARI